MVRKQKIRICAPKKAKGATVLGRTENDAFYVVKVNGFDSALHKEFKASLGNWCKTFFATEAPVVAGHEIREV